MGAQVTLLAGRVRTQRARIRLLVAVHRPLVAKQRVLLTEAAVTLVALTSRSKENKKKTFVSRPFF